MGKFDLMSNDELKIELMGSRGQLVSELDDMVKGGDSGKNMEIDVEGDRYGIFNITETPWASGKSVTVLWATQGIGTYCAGALCDLFIDDSNPAGNVIVVTKDEKSGKYGPIESFKMMGCQVTGISKHANGNLLISAEYKGKFTGIKTFMKRLENS